jgi:hypothetical protein
VDAGAATLGVPSSAQWISRTKNTYWGPDPIALAPSLDGRRLFLLTDNGPALHSFGLRANGQLSGSEDTCVGRAPSCRNARGLSPWDSRFSGVIGEQLVQSRDGAFLYVLGNGAAVFRLRR